MTAIQITPTWPVVKPQGFYVYVHIRAMTGEPFYVGKGSRERGWVTTTKKQHWLNTALKNGVLIQVIRDGMTSPQAFDLEKKIISDYRKLGYRLVNKTDGGEGNLGGAASTRRTVYCSNGMSFDSLYHARDWLIENGYPKAGPSAISIAARGGMEFCYGHSWSYVETPQLPRFRKGSEKVSSIHKTLQAKKVYCSNGMDFISMAEAARWLQRNGWPKARSCKISDCANGKRCFAYSYVWSLTGVPNAPYTTDPHEHRLNVRWGKEESRKGR